MALVDPQSGEPRPQRVVLVGVRHFHAHLQLPGPERDRRLDRAPQHHPVVLYDPRGNLLIVHGAGGEPRGRGGLAQEPVLCQDVPLCGLRLVHAQHRGLVRALGSDFEHLLLQ